MTEPSDKQDHAMAILRELKQKGEFSQITRAIPYTQFLGISIDQSTGELLGKMAFSERIVGNPILPAIHGGTLGALLESTAIFQLLWEVDLVALPKIVTITVDYLRSARPVDTFAKGVITKQGRRVVNVRVEAWQEDRSRPVATANTHFLVKPAG
jgi:acyl-coenzyme A thioesterase PaaI-like protein